MIIVNFPKGTNTVTSEPLYQWDYGQKLKITGAGLQVCQVHFCDRTCNETIVRIAGVTADATGIEVAIPDRLLENEYPINAFVYYCGENEGQTIKHIQIPVIKRKRPEEYVDPVPDNIQTQMEEMLANANAAIQTIQGYYGATLTFGELYKLIQDEVDTKIDDINQVTQEYWDAVEQSKADYQESKKADQNIRDHLAEVDSTLFTVDRYVHQKIQPTPIGATGLSVGLGVDLPEGDYEITVTIADVISESDSNRRSAEKYIGERFTLRGTKRNRPTEFKTYEGTPDLKFQLRAPSYNSTEVIIEDEIGKGDIIDLARFGIYGGDYETLVLAVLKVTGVYKIERGHYE